MATESVKDGFLQKPTQKEVDEWWMLHPVSTQEAYRVMSDINEFAEEPFTSHINAFAEFLARPYKRSFDKYGSYLQTTPRDFSMHAHIWIAEIEDRNVNNNLHSSRNFFADIPTPENLNNLTDDQINSLYLAIPMIAKIAFPDDFAAEVIRGWDEILIYKGLKQEPPPIKIVNEISPITEVVTSAGMAKFRIIDPAEDILASLDWNWAMKSSDLTDVEIRKLFQIALVPVFKDLQKILPVKFLSNSDNESELLEYSDIQKFPIGEGFMLIVESELNQDQATYIKDFICSYVIEIIAYLLGETREGADIVSSRLLLTNPGLQQAFSRIFKAIEGNGF